MSTYRCDPSALADLLKELDRLGERVVYVRPIEDELEIITAHAEPRMETR